MERAIVIAEWQQVGGVNTPVLAQPLPAGASWMDATGQPAASLIPDPNVVLLEVWAESDYLDSLGDDVLTREAMANG